MHDEDESAPLEAIDSEESKGPGGSAESKGVLATRYISAVRGWTNPRSFSVTSVARVR